MAFRARDEYLKITADSVAPTLTLADVKAYLRVTHTSDDTLIATLVLAAIQHIELRTGISIFLRSLSIRMPFFPASGEIELLKGPLASFTNITYLDSAGDSQTFSSSNYTVNSNDLFPILRLVKTSSWPMTDGSLEAVQFNYNVGYANEAAIPSTLRLAILYLTSHFYDTRTPFITTGAKPQQVDFTINSLIDEFRRPKLY